MAARRRPTAPVSLSRLDTDILVYRTERILAAHEILEDIEYSQIYFRPSDAVKRDALRKGLVHVIGDEGKLLRRELKEAMGATKRRPRPAVAASSEGGGARDREPTPIRG